MKTIYIPRGETVQYERLAADRLVVRGCLRVADSLRAKTICGDGVIHAGSVQAKAGRRKASWMNCRRWRSSLKKLSCSFRRTMWRRLAERSRN